MPTYTQDGRPLSITTPLGKDILLLIGIYGAEAVSQLFHFRFEALAENKTDVAFDKLLGQKVSAALTLPDNKTQRWFSGIVQRVAQGERDQFFTIYEVEIVPPAWLLTRRTQSRIFQHMSVPDVLKKVLTGVDASFELQASYEERDFLVQYRETDFNFLSRLCEEEGIYYFFKHSSGGCQMVFADTPQSHPDMPAASSLIYDTATGGNRPEDRIYQWRKAQELRSGKVTLWDHCFELPHKHLETNKVVQDTSKMGEVTHKLAVGGNQSLELYDWPGGYAKRFDGVDKGGGDNPSGLDGVTPAGKRLSTTRMQEDAAAGLVVEGVSKCRQLTSGYKFTLQRHFNGKGPYVVLAVDHVARMEVAYRSNEAGPMHYENRFRCLPLDAPFRPPCTTPRPVVHGTQTAVVVGKPGDEIFTDKYGRIKVQFHWDRQGKNDADSSCWVRVATPWAGQQWGMIHIPRVGQEVVIAFEEGDPDRPISVGSVYNADMMPPYKLPDNKTQSGVKSRSSLKGTAENFNEICFEDKKGEELLYIRAEKDQKIAVENDEAHWVGHDRVKEVDHDETTTIGNDRTETVKNDETITIHNNRTETVEQGNEQITVKQGNRTVEISMGNETLNIKMGNQSTKLDLGASSLDAMQSITLTVGQSSIKLDPTGVTIQGMMITITGQVQTQISGLMTQISGSAMLQESGGIIMIG
ncbi:MAG TPA: type VI secretion system tip protein TssI/VgrG [Gemmataceae bacterium]|nr:type VI secretion system tip protein TssI/VgrG [Gemmataceae bacterium]